MQAIQRGLIGMVLALSAWATAWAASGAWEPVKQGQSREDISTWVRRVEGMPVKAFRGVTEVKQSTPTVLALLADIPNLSNWVFKCYSSTQPEGFAPDHTYARFKGIWPASPRDALFRTVVTQQADMSVLVESREVSGYPPDSEHVRMPYLHNTFRLTPLKGGWTRVEFETQIDLGGLVPTWIANLVSTEAAWVTLDGLKKQVTKSQYQVKSVNELPAYYLKGEAIVLPTDH